MKKSHLIIAVLIAGITGLIIWYRHTNGLFTKEKWRFADSPSMDVATYPKRDAIVDDLVTNYRLKGKSYREIRQLLGNPNELESDGQKMSYRVLLDYGWDIDPQHTKDLYIRFDKDVKKYPDARVQSVRIAEHYAQ